MWWQDSWSGGNSEPPGTDGIRRRSPFFRGGWRAEHAMECCRLVTLQCSSYEWTPRQASFLCCRLARADPRSKCAAGTVKHPRGGRGHSGWQVSRPKSWQRRRLALVGAALSEACSGISATAGLSWLRIRGRHATVGRLIAYDLKAFLPSMPHPWCIIFIKHQDCARYLLEER